MKRSTVSHKVSGCNPMGVPIPPRFCLLGLSVRGIAKLGLVAFKKYTATSGT